MSVYLPLLCPLPQLRDGEDAQAPLLYKTCGSNTLPAPVNTTSQHLYVHFVSDPTVAYNGFRLEYMQHGECLSNIVYTSIVKLNTIKLGLCTLACLLKGDCMY